MRASRIVLFDVDGTLMRRTGPQHKDALSAGIKCVTGRQTTLDGIPTQGMLDHELILLMLAASGSAGAVSDQTLGQIAHSCEQAYLESSLADLRHCLCPGVEDLLQILTANKIPCGLVTGNLPAIGRRKIQLAGLSDFFTVAAFSGVGRTRADLAQAAIAEASECGLILAGAEVYLIGDHPNDIAAAKANDYYSIGVATGLSSVAELEAASPWMVVSDLVALAPTCFWQIQRR